MRHVKRPRSPYPWVAMTDEKPARRLTVKGRSLIDPDCLVFHFDGDTVPGWLIEDSMTVLHPSIEGIRVHATRTGKG